MSNQGTVLLTGATGFVGMELLARYLERGPRRVVAIVRAPDDGAARKRIERVLANVFGSGAEVYADRVDAVAGELTSPLLGLDPKKYEDLAAQVDSIVHSAASVSFALPLEEARAINVEGTRNMLALAERTRELGGLTRYAHISTAYVAGTHAGRFAECDLDVGQSFRNSYEQSKFEAEQLVRSRPLPYTILRPSIVVGDQRSGWTAAFNVLYWPLRAFARGLFTTVPALPSAPVDVVSIDYVCDAIHELCEEPGGVGETYHLTAGAHASTIQEIAHAASRYFNRPMPRVLSPLEWGRLNDNDGGSREGKALEGGSVYFPYFSVGTVFDDAATRARLEPSGIRVTPLGDYLERLLDFATRSRWGKRPIARVEALAR